MSTYSSDASGDLIGEAPQNPAAPPIVAPHIIAQPVDQMVSAGDFASFSVIVANTNGVKYQWVFANEWTGPHGTEIAGATGDSLLLAAVAAGNAGRYWVNVTNGAGTVQSSPATLVLDTGTNTATPPLRMTAYSDIGGQVTVTPFQRTYSQGQQVTVTATPSAPYMFIGWSGNPATNPLTMTVTADTTLRARFAAPLPPHDNLVSWWRGEPTTSPTVLDSIDANNGGFFAASAPTATSPSYTPDGKVGGAIKVGGNTYVQIPDGPNLRPLEFTLEAWVSPTALSGDQQTVVGRGGLVDESDEQWWLGLLSGTPQFVCCTNSTPNLHTLAATAAVPLNEWTHLAATFDGTTAVLYVNGLQVASQGGLGPIIYAPTPVCIGATWQFNNPDYLFTGCIDEVSLYNRALDCDEIFAIYNADIAGKNHTTPYFTTQSPMFTLYADGASYTQQLTTALGAAPTTLKLSDGALPPNLTLSPAGTLTGTLTLPGIFDFTVAATDAAGNCANQLYVLNVVAPMNPPPGLISWWRGEPTTSATVFDSIDANNGGFFNLVTTSTSTAASPSYKPDGKVGGAFDFNGSNFVQILDAPNLQPPKFTVEAWVLPTVPSRTAGYQTVIGRGSSSTTNTAQWWLGLLNGMPQFFSHEEVQPLVAPTAIPFNVWTHLAATFDGATKLLYVNGIQVASQGGLGPITYATVPVGIGAAWQGPAGEISPSDTFTGLFNGSVDEVSLYNRALSPGEISAIVTAGAAGKSIMAPYITTGVELPAAAVGQPYTQTFTWVLGTPPVSFTLAAASATPPGLTLTPAGVLSGTPSTAGAFQITVIATDSAELSDQQTFALQVNA